MTETYDKLIKRIMILNECVWERRVPLDKINQWLENFTGRITDIDNERIHALFWLSQFMYFGSREIRVLLRSLYRDLYLCPMIQEVRSRLSSDVGIEELEKNVKQEIARTRFFGVGNPSESGVHLLYYFRQENRLDKKNFMDTIQIFNGRTNNIDGIEVRALRKPDITRYIFLDDICGSGQTAIDYSREVLDDLLKANQNLSVAYYSIFATVDGLENVRKNTLFGNRCGAVYELDKSYRCASSNSRYFTTKEYPEIDPDLACKIAKEYGEFIGFGEHACGYDDSQMLMGFHHNTPDNTLPIIWADNAVHGTKKWFPIFKRYPKFLGAE